MVDIRPNVLPTAILPLRSGDALIVDQGADGVRQTDPFSMTDSVAPVATQAEAVAGTDNTKRMTALRTKQSIASEVGVSIASNDQGARADSAVQTVNGKSGNSVTITKADVGLGNVDNTSDASKPVSTATQTALELKANSSVTISAGTGLDGGGDLSANRSLALNSASIASLAKADTSVQTVNGVLPVAGNVTVAAEEKRLQDTRTTAISESFPINVLFVETAGYSSVGDGGGALYKRVSSEPTHAGKFQSADGAWWEIVDRVLRPEMFGIKGDGSDETVLLQGMFDFAGGKEIAWPVSKTYGYMSLEIPNDVKWSGIGFTLRRLVASTSPGIRINNWFRAESLVISTPGGTGGDKAIRWQGSNNHIKYLDVRADAEGNDSSTNWAIEMESNPTGSTLSRNNIDAAYCLNFSTFLFGTNISLLNVENVTVEKYRTAVYFRDIVRSRLVNFTIRGLGNAVNGRAGENGLLLEARTNNATSDLVIENWTVEDSGEHAYRLGGQQTIRNITFNRCISRRSGSSILSGNLSSGEWHGGCGFKVLGGASVGASVHKNIVFNQCEVYDINPTVGTYPAGHGSDNFSGFYISRFDGVFLNECRVDGEALEYSCWKGVLIGSGKNIHLNDCDIRKTFVQALAPQQEEFGDDYPGYRNPLEGLYINGGRYEVTQPSGGVVFYMSTPPTYAHKDWVLRDPDFLGGQSAIRIENIGTGGSFSGCVAKLKYTTTNVDPATTNQSVIPGNGAANWLVDIITQARPSAPSMTVANGSIEHQINTGIMRLRKAGTWTAL